MYELTEVMSLSFFHQKMCKISQICPQTIQSTLQCSRKMSFTWSLSCPVLRSVQISSQCLGISIKERPKGKVRLTVLLSSLVDSLSETLCGQGCLGLLVLMSCLLYLPVYCAVISPSLHTFDWGTLSGCLATKIDICI